MKLLLLAALSVLVSCSGGAVEVYERPADAGTAADGGTSGTGDARVSVDATSPDDGSEANDAGVDMGVIEPEGPTRYDPTSLKSPITPNVAQTLRSIRSGNASPDDSVFMKVGASGTVNSNFLDCFATTDVAGANASLQPTVSYFRATDVAGQTSWDRDTVAAVVGRTASWVQSGSPSPLEREIAALNPRFALVNYGTNDMQQGLTHQTALWPFWDNMWTLLTGLMADGVVPIVTGLNPRSDSVEAAYWVPTYNEVTRAMAQTLQLPYIDLYNAVVEFDDMGLISDGIHGNASPNGACLFDASGLRYNYNVRNLLTLEVLDATRRAVVHGDQAPDRGTLSWSGVGSTDDPVSIDALPFAHDGDTTAGPSDALDAYPACDSGQDESGPEYVYRLDLAEAKRVRAMVFDGPADVDLHHLAGNLDAASCVSRDDRIVQGLLQQGTHYFVVDTYVGSAGEQAGAFTFVVVECEPGDSACD